MSRVLFELSAATGIAASLSRAMRCSLGEVEQRHFPDGESYVRLATGVEQQEVILLCTLDRPDSKILPLLFAAEAARAGGARSVGLIAPYLAYLRQDIAFQEGEAVTSAVFASILCDHIDWLVTLDPHLHRYRSLSEVYSIPAATATAAEVIGTWIRRKIAQPVLIGPDEESRQWVDAVAEIASAPAIVLRKQRASDASVAIDSEALADMPQGTPVILDDIVSSAGTMIEAVRALKDRKLPRPICVAVHPVFAGDAFPRLLSEEPIEIISTNSVAHPTNAIDISEVLGRAAESLLRSIQPLPLC